MASHKQLRKAIRSTRQARHQHYSGSGQQRLLCLISSGYVFSGGLIFRSYMLDRELMPRIIDLGYLTGGQACEGWKPGQAHISVPLMFMFSNNLTICSSGCLFWPQHLYC